MSGFDGHVKCLTLNPALDPTFSDRVVWRLGSARHALLEPRIDGEGYSPPGGFLYITGKPRHFA